MKMYRLSASGCVENYIIKYYYSTNFMDYIEFKYTGPEQEKYNEFLDEISNNIAPQPVYIGVKMVESKIDRALSRSDIFNTKDVRDFIFKIIKYKPNLNNV